MTCTERNRSVLWKINISPKRQELDAHGNAVLRGIHELGLGHVDRVASSRLFFIQSEMPSQVLERIAAELLSDPVTEDYNLGEVSEYSSPANHSYDGTIEVHLKGGVMDPVASSTLTAVADMGIDTSELAIATARLYRIKGIKSADQLDFVARQLLSNDCIEDVYISGFGREDTIPDHLPVAPSQPFELRHIAIRKLDDEALKRLSRKAHLFLSVEEMRTIRDYYRKQQRDPTDVELEMLAQTWSEHCVHKTLKSAVRYQGMPLPSTAGVKQKKLDEQTVEVVYDNLLKDTIIRATRELIDSGKAKWCLSVFVDNAGIIALDDEYGIAFKVETHNHPSAIEPYGGAATGIGGVIRDVLGCGLGAKPIANTDVFCVGQPDFPMEALPKGVLHPRRVLKGVVSGVRDYGNRMGIPTVNGAILFDDRYLGNPLVFCGCIGLIPRDCIDKEPQPGDLIVVIGGRTGRDGIHGATFSSAELTDTHADEFSHAVQIGNAITEKQVLDAMLQARDHADGCLYTATTDCGAGGLSSAVGEMGCKLGAEVDLEKVPLKYAGLRYDEIWISEAQERMVFSVPPDNWPKIKTICDAENVEATVIGSFRNDGHLLMRYEGQTVGDLDAEFLHEGIPQTQKQATWNPAESLAASPSAGTNGKGNYREMLLAKLAELNTCSKEWVFRQYDHEVQGASVVKPLAGPGEGPSDAAVIRPRLDSDKGLAISNGIAPGLADVDPYWMAVAAIDEAVRNAVCVGGNPARTAILDNFCWGNCEDPQTMGALVRACQGCYDAAITYGVPFISGKDSLNNEFALDAGDAEKLAERVALHNGRIRIPSTLLISAISIIDDVNKCVTMDAKQIEGEVTSFFFVGLEAEQWSDVDITQAAGLHVRVSELISAGKILAVHDCGDEGILPALAEMAFAGQCGIDASFSKPQPFAPIPCGYVVQVAQDNEALIIAAGKELEGVVLQQIGRTRKDQQLTFETDSSSFEIDLNSLSNAWRSGLDW